MANILKIKNSIVKFFLEIFILNKHKRATLKARWTKLNLEKYANIALEKRDEFKPQQNSASKIIWQYWHQGEERAPEIIKKCLNSIKKNYPDYNINVLSFDTIKDYVNLPPKYYDLLKKKKIPIAIFSDILRLNLLSKYGGVWIDATMLATGKLPEDILNSDFFMFQKNPKIDSAQNNNSCYFINSKANSLWINLIKTAIEAYWKENDFLINYFMFEHMVTILSDKLQEEWSKIPKYSTADVCKMQDMFFEKFEPKTFDEILKKSNIHKLTYKKTVKNNKEETFLEKIMQRY